MNNLVDEQLLTVENQYWVDLKADLDWLTENKRFQNLILNGYFKDKAINGVSLLAQDAIVKGGHRPAVMEDLVAISKLQDFFITVENLGTVVEDDDDSLDFTE